MDYQRSSDFSNREKSDNYFPQGRLTRQQSVNLHYQDDKDFMEGRTDSCWIIFECDPEPIVNRIGKKIKQVEK